MIKEADMLQEAAIKSGYHRIVLRPNFIVGQSKVSNNTGNSHVKGC